MLTVQVNEEEMDDIIREEIKSKLSVLTHRHTFWDLNELSRQTCMSIKFIRDNFFFNEDFPKFRVGRKWLMPAEETEQYLLAWLKSQSRQ